MAFSYTVIKKETFLVMAFAGTMDRMANEVLEDCAEEIQAASPSAAILHMHAVTSVKSESYRAFANLAKALKSSRIPYRYVALDPIVKKFLIEDGLISRSEAKDTLEGAMKELMGEAGITKIS